MNNKELISSMLALAFFGGLFFYGINVYKNVKNQEQKNARLLTCGTLYRYSSTSKEGITTAYPMKKEFEECLLAN